METLTIMLFPHPSMDRSIKLEWIRCNNTSQGIYQSYSHSYSLLAYRVFVLILDTFTNEVCKYYIVVTPEWKNEVKQPCLVCSLMWCMGSAKWHIASVYVSVMGRLMVCASSVPFALTFHLLSSCHQLARASAAVWLDKGCIMCNHVYVIMHVKDP